MVSVEDLSILSKSMQLCAPDFSMQPFLPSGTFRQAMEESADVQCMSIVR